MDQLDLKGLTTLELNSFLAKWVKPFYKSIPNPNSQTVDELKKIKPEISLVIIEELLKFPDYRTRSVASFFTAMINEVSQIDQIGKLLLESEVAYAGKTYCYVLAYFNTSPAISFIDQYLSRYLTRPELYYDQMEAMEAALYLDTINGTSMFDHYSKAWKKFVEEKNEFWKKPVSDAQVRHSVAILTELAK